MFMPDPPVEPTEDPCPAPIVEYVCRVITLIEGRRVSRDDIFKMVEQIWRQHCLCPTGRTDYVCEQLNKSPP